MLKTRTLLTLVLVPLLAFVIACGGDDDDDGGDSGSTGGDQPAATEASGGTGGSGDSSSSSDDEEEEDTDTSTDLDGAEILENCPELLSFLGSASSGAFASPGADVGDDLADLEQYLQNAADNAPDEVAGDFQIIADAYATFFGILQEYDVDFSNPASFATLDAEAQAELQVALEELGTDEVIQASENITTWFEENCD